MRKPFTILLVLVSSLSFTAHGEAETKHSMNYDALMSMCKFVVPQNHPDLPLNTISPLSAAQFYFHTRGTDLNIFQDPRLGLAPEPFKETLIEGPLHGKIVDRIYYPKDGYLGQDKMIFMVEVRNKIFKVIYSVWVDSLALEDVIKNPEHIKKCPDGYQTKELTILK